MEITRFQKISIMIRSIWACLRTFTKSLLRSFLGQMTRDMADTYIREWANWLLDVINLNIKTTFYVPFKLDPEKRYIIMTNHASLYDIPIVFSALPGSIRMLTKQELRKIPMFGLVLQQNEFIFIDRQHPMTAKRDLARARAKMEDGIILWTAPEGTRSRTGELLPFKKGVFRLAIETGATIIPVGLRDTHTLLPAKTWNFHTHQTIEVHVGDFIESSDYNLTNLQALSHHVETVIRSLIQPTPKE